MGRISWWLVVIGGLFCTSFVCAIPATSFAKSANPNLLASFLDAARECRPSSWEQNWKFGAIMVTYEYRILGPMSQQKCHLEVWIIKLEQESLPGLNITDVPEGSNYNQRQFTCFPTSVQLQRMIQNVANEKYSKEDFLSCRREAQ